MAKNDTSPFSIKTNEKKKTLGQQVLDNYEKNQGTTQTVRDTTNEMGKKYMESLWKLVEQHKSLKEDYYIMEIMQPDTFLEGVIKVKHIARRSRPNPEWGVALYKVHVNSGEVTYEWGLPHVEEAIEMMKMPEGLHPKVIQDIVDFAKGALK